MTPGTQRYIQAARDAGCPADQLRRFLAGGLVLQPRQLAASAAARLCDSPGGPVEIGYGGARGCGKSHWLLGQMGADDCQRFPGLKCLLLRKVGKANKENFEDLRGKLLTGLPHAYNRQEGVLTFANGSRIVAGHFQSEKDINAYLGLEYDVIGVEEATTLSSAKYRAIQTTNRTSKAGWRPRMYSTTNPGGIGHAWYKARFVEPARRSTEADTRFVPATVDDNHFVNPEYRQVLDTLTGWQLRAWRHGDWDIAAGQFFTTFRQDVHVVEPFDLQPGWRKWLGLDYGFTHFTSAHLLAKDGDGNVFVVEEHGERGWLPQRHAPALDAMLARRGLTASHLWKCVAGADVFAKKGDGLTIAEKYDALGWTLTVANDDRVNGAGELLTRLGDPDHDIPPRLFIFETCRRLIETIPALQHDPHRPEDVLKVDCDDKGLGGDDFYDSARYGLMADYQAVPDDVTMSFYGAGTGYATRR